MRPDDKICHCCNVSYRKLINFARRERPRRASQLTECLGAGTGCGWCIPFLKKIFEATSGSNAGPMIDLSPEEYSHARRVYVKTNQPKNEF